MSYPYAASPAKGERRVGLILFGVVLLIVGIGVGTTLAITGGTQYEDAIKKLQRAPVGCDTEFNFTGTGTFIFYIETSGATGEVRGDCENTGSYDRSGELPKVKLRLTPTDDPEDRVSLGAIDTPSYDAAGFRGQAYRELRLAETGMYTLSVQSDDDDFAIAVGRKPPDKTLARNAGVAVGVAGLLIGGLVVALGMRRKPVVGVPGGPPQGVYGGGGFPYAGGYPPQPGLTGPPLVGPPGQYAPGQFSPQQYPAQQYPPQQYPPQNSSAQNSSAQNSPTQQYPTQNSPAQSPPTPDPAAPPRNPWANPTD